MSDSDDDYAVVGTDAFFGNAPDDDDEEDEEDEEDSDENENAAHGAKYFSKTILGKENRDDEEDEDEEEEEEAEEEEAAEETDASDDLGQPLYVVFNRSWFSVPRVARTSAIPGVVRCYDRTVTVESAERLGQLVADHKSWPSREPLLDMVTADQVVVLQGHFKDDPTLRYVWGVILGTAAAPGTDDARIFRTLPKRVYGELLSAYSKDAELVGSSLLDMESTDNNSRSFNPTVCGWQRITLDGFPKRQPLRRIKKHRKKSKARARRWRRTQQPSLTPRPQPTMQR